MWTEITRPKYERSGRRSASDATDAEWSHIAPLLPSAKPGGRPRTTNLRDVFDAILYMASTGCQWRMLPNDYPPVSTVRRYFYDWRDNGVLRTINHYLVMAAREAMGREASPTAGVVDIQSVKTTESVGIRGYDAGKKINGRKRHIVTDTTGLLVGLAVHGAEIEMGLPQFSIRSAMRFRGFDISSPIAAARALNSEVHWRRSVAGHCKSSNAPTLLKASKFCPGASSASAPLLG